MQNSAASAAADKQMAFQEASNERQMAFQKESAQHGYQWATEDMKKAGINPILAYKQGGSGTLSGASSGGASYTPQNIGAAAVSAGSTGAATALAQTRQTAELDNMAADTALKGAQDKTQSALQVQALASAGQAGAQTALAREQADTERWQRALIQSTHRQQLPKEILAQLDAAYYSTPAAAPLHTARRWAEAISGVGNAASAINPFK